MLLKLKMTLLALICLMFLTVALYGMFFSEAKEATIGATLSAGFGLIIWFKWTETHLQIENKEKGEKEK